MERDFIQLNKVDYMSSRMKYKLKCTGKEITSSTQLSNLTQVEVEELFDTPVSQWEYMELRRLQHEAVGQHTRSYGAIELSIEGLVKKVDGIAKDIKNKNTIMVGNGGDELVPRDVNEVVAEVHSMLKDERRKVRTKTVLKENQKFIFLGIVIVFCLVFFFHEQLSDLMNIMEENWKVSLGAVSVPIIIMTVKKVFFK